MKFYNIHYIYIPLYLYICLYFSQYIYTYKKRENSSVKIQGNPILPG